MITSSIACLDRIRSQEEFEKLRELARQDSHGLYTPTQVVRKNGEIAGYFSVGAHPHVLGWLSRDKMTPRDSVGVINTMECFLAVGGTTHVAFPMPKRSPFHNLMPALGYTNLDEYSFFVKQL